MQVVVTFLALHSPTLRVTGSMSLATRHYKLPSIGEEFPLPVSCCVIVGAGACTPAPDHVILRPLPHITLLHH